MNVDVSFAFLDYFDDLGGGGKRSGGCNDPNIASVGLRRGGVDIENNLARISQVWIGVDVPAGNGRSEIGGAKPQSCLRFVRAEPQRGSADARRLHRRFC